MSCCVSSAGHGRLMSKSFPESTNPPYHSKQILLREPFPRTQIMANALPDPPRDIHSVKRYYNLIDDYVAMLFPTNEAPTPKRLKQTSASSSQQIDFPSFPPEIRNRIMDFVLRPGDIYRTYSRNGIQLLATCHENYRNGYLMYYADNIFHLPRGRHHQGFINRYNRTNRALIRRMKITCSMWDLEEILANPPEAPSYRDDSFETAHELRNIEFERLVAIARFFPGLEELCLDFPDLPKWGFGNVVPPRMRNYLLTAGREEVLDILSDILGRRATSMTLTRLDLRLFQAYYGNRCTHETMTRGVLRALTLLVHGGQAGGQRVMEDKSQELGGWEAFQKWFAEHVQDERRREAK